MVSIWNYDVYGDIFCSLWGENMSELELLLGGQYAFTAFEVMQILIHNGRTWEMWDYLISKISPEQMKETFIIPDDDDRVSYVDKGEYTLLTLLCHKCSCSGSKDWLQNEIADSGQVRWLQNKIADLVEHGADVNQMVGKKKQTALSYLVRGNDITLIKFCITIGADPTLGHLLVNASRFIDEHEYQLLTLSDPVNSDRERIEQICMYKNVYVFQFLLDLGLDYDQVDETGVTPLLAACAESLSPYRSSANKEKIQLLLEKEANLYVKTNEGVSVWDYAMRQQREQMFSTEDLYSMLLEAQFQERGIWEERLEILQKTRLDTFPVQILLPFFTQV